MTHRRYRLRNVATQADRAMRKLPEKVSAAIAEFIYATLLENPHRVGKALKNELAGYHSTSRGPYRIIYFIEDEDSAVDIIRIGHRSTIYF